MLCSESGRFLEETIIIECLENLNLKGYTVGYIGEGTKPPTWEEWWEGWPEDLAKAGNTVEGHRG